MNVMHYDGTPCPEDHDCVNRKLERALAENERLKADRWADEHSLPNFDDLCLLSSVEGIDTNILAETELGQRFLFDIDELGRLLELVAESKAREFKARALLERTQHALSTLALSERSALRNALLTDTRDFLRYK